MERLQDRVIRGFYEVLPFLRKRKIEKILKEKYGFSTDTEVKFSKGELTIINDGITIKEYDTLGRLKGVFKTYGVNDAIGYVSREHTRMPDNGQSKNYDDEDVYDGDCEVGSGED